MPPTKRGIYHNLKESKYVVSNTEITFFFSSETYLEKFLDGYQQHREKFLSKVYENPLNMNTLADIWYYHQIEKRGFYVWLKGVEINWQDLHRYALRKMTEKNTLNWSKVQKPKLAERRKNMEQWLTLSSIKTENKL